MHGDNATLSPGLSALSDRERQVLEMAAAGMLDKNIAADLGLSANTLRTYWTRIRAKLGDGTRAALVAKLITHSIQGDEGADIPHLTHEGWILDVPTMTMIASDSINDLHGLERGVPHPAREYSRLYHPEDREEARSLIYDVIEGREDGAHVLFRLATDSGVELVHLTVRSVRGDDGRVRRVYGYRARTLDCRPGRDPAVMIGHWERDYPEKTVWIDDDFAAMAGKEKGGVIPISEIVEMLLPEDREHVAKIVLDAIANGTELVQNEAAMTRPDGKVIWTRTTRRFIPMPDGKTKILGTVIRFS